MLAFAAFDLFPFVFTQLSMLLLTCASLQPQATPSWLPGSLHEPRSQVISSDTRNLAHQQRKFHLGPAPLRLLLLVPVSVLFGSSSPETHLKREGKGLINKMCWWSAKTKTKFCSFIVVSNDRQQFYKHTCPTNTIHFSDQITCQIWTIHRCLFPLPPQLSPVQVKKACDWHPISNTFWQLAVFWVCMVRFQTLSEEQEAGLCTGLKTSDPECTYPYYSRTHLSFCHRSPGNSKRKTTLKIALCPSSLLRFGTRNWIHHLHHCCEEQSKEWTTGWQKKDR